jgi:transposase, IS30 family
MRWIAMGKKYSHLTLEERCRLRGLMEMDLSIGEIARRMGRHRSTIHRELGRNHCVDGYRPDSAARRAWARKLRGSRIMRSIRLRVHVEDRLAMGWSPEQITGRMELDGSEHRLSAESIYRHVYSAAGRRAGLHRLLAQRKPKRG